MRHWHPHDNDQQMRLYMYRRLVSCGRIVPTLKLLTQNLQLRFRKSCLHLQLSTTQA